MLKIPEEQQRACYASGYFRRYSFEFDGFTIGNDNIHSESVIIKEAICEDSELKLGGCIASSCEFEVSETVTDNINLSGLRFKVYLHTYRANTDYNTQDIDNPDCAIGEEVGSPIPMGVFNVRSVEMVDDADYKRVIAYDDLYDWNVDVSEWYNSTMPTSIKHITYTDTNGNIVDDSKGIPEGATRKSSMEFVGMPIGLFRCELLKHLMSLNGNFNSAVYNQITSLSYPNDNIMITKTMHTDNSGSLTGLDLLRYVCELNGGFGRINRQGVFEIISLGASSGFYPENNVFPEDSMGTSRNLYPEDNFIYLGGDSEGEDTPDFISTHYEEYNAQSVSCVTLYAYNGIGESTETKDVDNSAKSVSYPNDSSNPYVSSNPLVLQCSESDLIQIARTMYESLLGIVYRPNTTTLQGVPYYEPGDYYNVTKKIPFESFVFSRTLIGIQRLRDEFAANGLEFRENNASVGENIYSSMGESYETSVEQEQEQDEKEDKEENQTATFEHDNNHFLSVVASSNYAWDDNKYQIDEYGFGAPEIKYKKRYEYITGTTYDGKEVIHVYGLPKATEDLYYSAYYCDDNTGNLYIVKGGMSRNKKYFYWHRKTQFTTKNEIYDYEDFTLSDVGKTYLDEETGTLYRLVGWNLSSEHPRFRWDIIAHLEKVTVQLETRIEQNEEAISLEASKRYSEDSYLSGRINVTAGEISSEVTRAMGAEQQLYSSIRQSAGSISMSINGTAGKNTSAGITISLYDRDGNLVDSESGNIYIDGNVVFSNQLTDGVTQISGANITTGTIDADRINLKEIASKTNEPVIFPQWSGIQIGSSGQITNIGYGQIDTNVIHSAQNALIIQSDGYISLGSNNNYISGNTYFYNQISVDGYAFLKGDMGIRRIYGINNGALDTISDGLYCYTGNSGVHFDNVAYINGGICTYASNYMYNMQHGTSGDNFVRINSSGCLVYTSQAGTESARRYKYDIKPVENIDLEPHKILDIPVKQFKFNNLSELPPEDQNKDVIGMIAEDVAEAYPVAAVYRNGQIENWDERYMIPPMLFLMQEMYQKINVLENKIIELGGN